MYTFLIPRIIIFVRETICYCCWCSNNERKYCAYWNVIVTPFLLLLSFSNWFCHSEFFSKLHHIMSVQIRNVSLHSAHTWPAFLGISLVIRQISALKYCSHTRWHNDRREDGGHTIGLKPISWCVRMQFLFNLLFIHRELDIQSKYS